jgi:hypothetical protein
MLPPAEPPDIRSGGRGTHVCGANFAVFREKRFGKQSASPSANPVGKTAVVSTRFPGASMLALPTLGSMRFVRADDPGTPLRSQRGFVV